ncbi:MAG: hypothetical protein JXA77_12880 [Bacteroidales bacterium]|nr:hypothetical protein [Bacteroidales bacterium]
MNPKQALFAIAFFLLTYYQTAHCQISIQQSQTPVELYVQVKNYDEFINRFNFQIDFKGNPIDNSFRQNYTRKQVIETLFDLDDKRLKPESKQQQSYLNIKNKFIDEVVTKNIFIKKDANLYARVSCIFTYKQEDIKIELFLKYTYDGDNAYRWALTKVKSEMLEISNVDDITHFITPNSDELGFSNLNRAFAANSSMKNIADSDFEYDELSAFLYLTETGALTFKNAVSHQYIYYGIPGYKVVIDEFNRTGYNTGWLISDIRKTN